MRGFGQPRSVFGSDNRVSPGAPPAHRVGSTHTAASAPIPRPLFLGHRRRRRQSGRRRMPLLVWFPSGARFGNPIAFFLSRTTNTLSNQQLEWFVPTMSTTAPQYCPGRLWIARARTATLHVPYPDTRLCAAEPTRCPECGACFVPRTGSGNADDWQKGWLAPLPIGVSAWRLAWEHDCPFFKQIT